MNITDSIIALLAPHICLNCSREGKMLCDICSLQLSRPVSRCYRCHKVTQQFQVCGSCRRKTGLSHVWVAAEYVGVAKDLVHKLKFERGKTAASDIAGFLGDALPLLDGDTIVTYVPTANTRVRQRGYDQAELIAKALARRRDYKFARLIERTTKTRQVGAKRKDRFAQLEGAFQAVNVQQAVERPILLVDDVLTTGATIEAAVVALRKAGVRSIDVVVFAH